ncbi:hypothetical protein [Flavobacterium sp. M31R6]|uniref:hypothetical protein n=1 Tax=Flavobacterium sp. M31R6 TaxID=2739062 RepID=UPI001567D723|nr:hypothetical protein [Flavobacterium sp. M31R6]QKJ63318.1 hypothetical protein HQN62_09290 [Flavobacterium sp. M31R6]
MKKDKHKNQEQKKKNKKNIPFMQVDRGGNIFTNFFSNFLKQFKNPTKTGLSKLLDKLLVIKIKESEKKPAEKPEKPLDIMGSVKTVFRYVNNNSTDNLTPSEKESLRQRTNQPLNIDIKTQQSKDEEVNQPRKSRLGI